MLHEIGRLKALREAGTVLDSSASCSVTAPTSPRQTARRIGAATEEVKASHVMSLTQPKALADVIDRAVQPAGQALP